MPTEAELRRENERMELEIAALQQSKGRDRRERVLQAAKQVAVVRGFDAELREILNWADCSSTTFYRHFETHDEVIAALVTEIFTVTASTIQKLLLEPDGPKRMIGIMHFAFSQFAEFGVLANQIAAGDVPAAYRHLVDLEGFWRFVGRAVRDCKVQGHFRHDVNTRDAVRTFMALVHPFRWEWCRRDGMTNQQIADETMEIFFSAFSI